MRYRLGLVVCALLGLGLLLTVHLASADPTPTPAPTSRPLLWRIAGDPPSYLYGTVHVPDARVTALPDAVQRAFDAAQVFCGEVPLDSAAQQRMARGAQLPAGQSLRQLLPAPLYERAQRLLASKGFPIQAFDGQKIWVMATTLGVLDYLRAMPSSPPPDLLLYQRAASAGKQLDALETIDEQLQLMDSIDRAGQISLLEQTLAELESVPPGAPGPVEKLVRAYLRGDEQELMRTAFEYADPDDPLTRRFLAAMIDERNHKMAQAIDARLRRERARQRPAGGGAEPARSYFIAIGALHIPGPEGVEALLAKRGYDLERLAAR
jgi:hypothetical protein